LKVYIHPFPIPNISPDEQAKFWDVVFFRAQIGLAPGWVVILMGCIFNVLLFGVAFGTLKLKDASSEVLPLESFEWHPLRQVSDWAGTNLKRRNPIRRAKKARQRIRSIHTTET